MVVSGSQQALDISARVVFNPGSRIWMEEPGYRFARNVFAIHGCQIVPVPVDYSGLDVAAAIKRCRTARALWSRLLDALAFPDSSRGPQPIQNGRRRSLRTLIRQSLSRVEGVLCVLPELVLFGVYRQRLSSH